MAELVTAAADPNPWVNGYNTACEILNALPGPMVALFARKLLSVNDDPADDPRYCAGFRQAMNEAASPKKTVL